MKISVGDRFLWATPVNNGSFCGEWVRVLKVGRLWAYFTRHTNEAEAVDEYTSRFDKATFQVYRGAAWTSYYCDLGRVYSSEAEYLSATAPARLWVELCDLLGRKRYNRPADLSAAAILKAADCLGFEMKEKS